MADVEAMGSGPPVSQVRGQLRMTRPAEQPPQALQPPGVFDKSTGLLASTAARAVLCRGPLLYGIDNQLWAYADGAWRPGEKDPAGDDIVHKRITWLLGERYRQAHEANILQVLRAMSGPLYCAPTPEVINFRNGLLPWRDGDDQLERHSPDLRSTAQLAVDWDPGASCPRFEQFLGQVLAPGDAERMWEVIGYLLMSGNPLHKIILLYARGFNGKGTLLRVLMAVAGERNVSTVSLHQLASNRFAPILLAGKLANICGDIDATYIESTGLLKQLTGEDPVSAEWKFRDSATFINWAVPVFSCNELPTSADTSAGWKRRWEVFSLPHVFSHDPGFEESLKTAAELRGIAARAVRSLRALMARQPPEFSTTWAGEAARREFEAGHDPLGLWLAEIGPQAPGAWMGRAEAFRSYKAWADQGGTRYPLGKQRFYALMRERFAETVRRGYPGYDGLGLVLG